MYVFYGLVSNILCSSGPENENSSGYFSGSSGFTLLWFFAMSFTLLCSNILSSVLCTLLNRKIYAFLLTYLLTYLKIGYLPVPQKLKQIPSTGNFAHPKPCIYCGSRRTNKHFKSFFVSQFVYLFWVEPEPPSNFHASSPKKGQLLLRNTWAVLWMFFPISELFV